MEDQWNLDDSSGFVISIRCWTARARQGSLGELSWIDVTNVHLTKTTNWEFVSIVSDKNKWWSANHRRHLPANSTTPIWYWFCDLAQRPTMDRCTEEMSVHEPCTVKCIAVYWLLHLTMHCMLPAVYLYSAAQVLLPLPFPLHLLPTPLTPSGIFSRCVSPDKIMRKMARTL